MTTDSSARYTLLNQLADDFAARYRRGERPSLQEYLDRHPDLADDIRELFPSLVEIEQVKDDRQQGGGPGPAGLTDAPAQVGDFRIIREIGRGGMGIVYEAEQVSLGRRVALKMLPRRMLEPRQRRRFEREARAAARLHHTNIVPVFAVGEHDGVPYFAMQFIQGHGLDVVLEELKQLQAAGGLSATPSDAVPCGSRRPARAADVARSLLTGEFRGGLGDEEPCPVGVATIDAPVALADEPSGAGRRSEAALSSSGLLPGQGAAGSGSRARKLTYWQSIAALGVQVADALEHAHRQGILHRDVKPSNLLLDTHGTVWVTDFGLAKADDQQPLTDTGDVLGTLRYMPPEAFEGRADARGDVYALGLTLYELLALRPAFDAPDRPRLIRQVTLGEPPRLDRVNRAVPRDLVTVIHKAIDRDSARRYASAAELAADLQRFLDDEPIQARRLSAAKHLWLWTRRNKGVAAALTAIALLLVTVAVGSALAAVYFQQQEQQQIALTREKNQLAEDEQARRKEAEHAWEVAQDRGDELRRSLYFAQMNLGGQAAESRGGIARISELLAPWPQHHPDPRGWEWYYLAGLCHRDLLTLRGHTNRVCCVAWSPDGKRLASAGREGAIRVWDAASGLALFTLRGHYGSVNSVAWSPDGKRLASAGDDGTARVWDVGTGREVLSLLGHGQGVNAVAWSPDGRRLASASYDRTVKVWDAADGHEVVTLRGHEGGILSLAWSPDGRQLASGGWDWTMRVWDVANSREVRTLRGYAGGLYSVAWSPDGRYLASGSDYSQVAVWEVASGQLTYSLPWHTDRVQSVAWSPDGKQLASASRDSTIQLWDRDTGRPALTLRGHTGEVFSVAWGPDGKRLASASGDGTAKVWDAAGQPEIPALREHTREVRWVAWSPDGKRLATSSADQTIKVWDAAAGRVEFTLRGHYSDVLAVAWSPDGKRLASVGWDRTVRVWDVAGRREVLALRGHTDGLDAVAWSPDGKRLASASWDHTVKVWDAEGGREVVTLRGHNHGVTKVVWSPDGKRLASSSWDHTVKVWDADGGRELLTLRGHSDGVDALAWSPDGRWIASGAADQTIRVWDAADGGERAVLRGHTGTVLSLAWSPDSRRLASGSKDHALKVWDAAAGRETLSLHGHTEAVWCVAWSPDGTCLASVSPDATLRLYDATRGYVAERSPRLLPVLDRRLADDPKDAKALRLRAEVRARQGDWDGAAADVREYLALTPGGPRWYATDWWVVGPYPDDLKESYPPESDPDPARPVAGPAVAGELRRALLRWQTVPRDAQGFVDFGALFGRAEHISAYALLRVYCPDEQTAAVLLGADDHVRLWLNGALVHEKRGAREAAPDEDGVPVTLRAGWNTLLAKVVNVTGAHALYLRLSDDPVDRARAEALAASDHGRWDEAERVIDDILAKHPDHAPTRALAEQFLRRRIEEDARRAAAEDSRRGAWAAVAADYARLVRLRPEDHWPWFRLAIVQAYLGHEEEYRRVRRGMLDRFGWARDPVIAERTAKACSLLPGIAEGREDAAALAGFAATREPTHPATPWFLLARALTAYRAGRDAEAAAWLEKVLATEGRGYVRTAGHFLLALAQHRVGRTEDARKTLARAREMMAHDMPSLEKSGDDWHDWMVCDLLRREAEALIENRGGP